MASRLFSLMFVALTGILGMVSPPDLVLMTAQAQTAQNRKAEADRLFNQGEQLLDKGQHQDALPFYQQSLDIYRALKESESEGVALIGVANVFNNLSQPLKAIEYGEQAVTVGKQIGNGTIEARALSVIGLANYFQGESQKAISYFERALEIAKQTKNLKVEARVLGFLANTRPVGKQKQSTEQI